MSTDPAAQLARCWRSNAQAWTQAVREGRIESRRLVTDAAIVQAALAGSPCRVLDLGCGEGWLCRALAAHGIEAVGTDASPALIDAARLLGHASYQVLSYAQLTHAPQRLGHFDAVVANFALFEEDLAPLLRALHSTVRAEGVLLIQTVHPWAAREGAAYQDGWRTETFAGFGNGFVEPMPWFYRTLASWVTCLSAAGWRIAQAREPVHPHTGQPASLLLACSQNQCTVHSWNERLA